MNGSIKQWKEDERPREKIIAFGSKVLSDAELLAIIISTGTKQKSAIDLSKEVLELAQNDWALLGRLNIKELTKIKGIGIAKAISIVATLEIGRRRQLQHPQDKVAIHSSESAVNFLQPILQDIAHEVFCVVYLNRANKIIKHELVSSGGLTATIVDVRIILKQAILEQAVGVIVAHNHPSGNATPSEADNLITKKLKQALEQVDIKLLDHIIIAGTNSYSYADDNML